LRGGYKPLWPRSKSSRCVRACCVFVFRANALIAATRGSLSGAQRGCSFKSALCVIRRGCERCCCCCVLWWRALIFDEAAECCVSHRMRDLLLIAPQRRDQNLCKKLALILLAGAVPGQMAANCRFMVILGPTYRRTPLGLVNFDLMRAATQRARAEWMHARPQILRVFAT
jgi:hypothetical protein